jgi:hypothetical protein
MGKKGVIGVKKGKKMGKKRFFFGPKKCRFCFVIKIDILIMETATQPLPLPRYF